MLRFDGLFRRSDDAESLGGLLFSNLHSIAPDFLKGFVFVLHPLLSEKNISVKTLVIVTTSVMLETAVCKGQESCANGKIAVRGSTLLVMVQYSVNLFEVRVSRRPERAASFTIHLDFWLILIRTHSDVAGSSGSPGWVFISDFLL